LVIGGYVPGAHGVEAIIRRVLQGVEADLRGARSEWPRAGDSETSLDEATAVGVARLSVRQPARSTQREVEDRHTSGAAAEAAQALRERCTAAAARVHLKAVIGALARLLVGTREAEHWAQFVARELRDLGPAFEILYDNLWGPGVELITRLIARIQGTPESDRAARVKAFMLISSLVAFQSGRSISLRAMNWTASVLTNSPWSKPRCRSRSTPSPTFSPPRRMCGGNQKQSLFVDYCVPAARGPVSALK
jgi:HTH-type transcriptional dual regulator CecR, C-terminal domain